MTHYLLKAQKKHIDVSSERDLAMSDAVVAAFLYKIKCHLPSSFDMQCELCKSRLFPFECPDFCSVFNVFHTLGGEKQISSDKQRFAYMQVTYKHDCRKFVGHAMIFRLYVMVIIHWTVGSRAVVRDLY